MTRFIEDRLVQLHGPLVVTEPMTPQCYARLSEQFQAMNLKETLKIIRSSEVQECYRTGLEH